MKTLRVPRVLLWLLLAATAGLLLWFNHHPQTARRPSATPAHLQQPEWVAHQADSWRLDLQQGEQLYIQAAQATHWKKTGLTHLQQPRGWLLKPDAAYRFEAEQGRTSAQHLHLQGDVVIQQAAPQRLRLESPQLDYDQTTRQVTSPSPLRLSTPQGWTRGVGLQWWLETQRLIIQREVHTHYAP